jgi:hypothetical protein
MPQSVPHNHHFVPQFLLRNFLENGKVWVYDLDAKTIEAKSTGGKKGGAGSIKDLYAWELKDGSTDYHSIEEFFSRGFENRGAISIRKLLQREFLSSDEALNFFSFVAAQYCRTPAIFGQITDSMAPTFQEMCERMAKYEPDFRARITRRFSETGSTPEEIERLLSAMGNGEMRVAPTRQLVMQQAFTMIENLAEELAKMKWCFLEVPAGDQDLIIGDHPVTLYDTGSDGESHPLGFRNPNIEIMLPLSKRMAACGRWAGPVSYGELERGSVVAANLRTLWFAQLYVYASCRSDSLLAEALRERPNGPKVRVSRVQRGERLVIATSFY